MIIEISTPPSKRLELKPLLWQTSNNRGDSKKAKLFITLKRSAEFFDNMKKFNEIREENEKTANKIQEESKDQWTIWDWACNDFPRRPSSMNGPEPAALPSWSKVLYSQAKFTSTKLIHT